jgi:DNA modification methylase
MLKEEDIPWNTVIYDDCMNEVNGLPTLPDNSIDLGFTDPVWGAEMKQNKRKYVKGRTLDNSDKQHFNDKKGSFTRDHFEQFTRVTKRQIFVINEKMAFWLIRNIPEKDPGILPIFWKNSPFKAKNAERKRHSIYLTYGKFETKLIHSVLARSYKSDNVEPFTYYWGFTNKEKHLNHPSPKGLEIPLKIFSELEPKSVLDPFAGSGTYLKAADILGVKWLGYEIDPNKKYCEDIDWRFAQKEITNFLEVSD